VREAEERAITQEKKEKKRKKERKKRKEKKHKNKETKVTKEKESKDRNKHTRDKIHNALHALMLLVLTQTRQVSDRMLVLILLPGLEKLTVIAMQVGGEIAMEGRNIRQYLSGSECNRDNTV
jgi:uncharacterized membrane protein YdbT with pleckstrin-like domain